MILIGKMDYTIWLCRGKEDERLSRKHILFIYPSMFIGGSTSSLLNLLNCLDPKKYQIDLQLFRNHGPLMGAIPESISLLPDMELYKGSKGRCIRLIKFVFSGYIFKAIIANLKTGKRGLSGEVLDDFQAKYLTRKSTQMYDYAIAYLEGWSNRHLAFNVNANKKYAWIHSTFSKTTSNPQAEVQWMRKVDKIVFVAEACEKTFRIETPAFSNKAITLFNIIDDRYIKKRSLDIDKLDDAYERYDKAGCFKIITMCRLAIKTKGLDRIVKCAKKLNESGKQFLWYIVGDGEDKATLLQLIRENQVEDCLVSIGARINPYPFLRISDIMCMPSRYEGMPMTVTESKILGVPPVVTAYLSAHEQIKDGVDGLIVENKEDSLFPVLLHIIENPKEIASLRSYLQKNNYGNRSYVLEIEKELFY